MSSESAEVALTCDGERSGFLTATEWAIALMMAEGNGVRLVDVRNRVVSECDSVVVIADQRADEPVSNHMNDFLVCVRYATPATHEVVVAMVERSFGSQAVCESITAVGYSGEWVDDARVKEGDASHYPHGLNDAFERYAKKDGKDRAPSPVA